MPSLRPIWTPAFFFNVPSPFLSLTSGPQKLSALSLVQLLLPRSQISQRWSEHFCNLFPGNETTWSSLQQNFKSFQAAHNDPDCPDNIVLEDLVCVFKHLFAGKALGTDGLPPGVYKLAPEKIAKLCLPLFRRAFSTRIEPIQF